MYKRQGYTEATNNFFQEVTDQKTMDEYFAKALEEITSFIKRMEVYAPEYKSSGMSFMFGLLTRLITSAVIEGDRRAVSYTHLQKNGRSVRGFRRWSFILRAKKAASRSPRTQILW